MATPRQLARPPRRLPTSRLSPRERDVLRLLADGYTTSEIAARCIVTTKTVEAHRRTIRHKTGITRLALLVRYALAQGLVTDQATNAAV